MKGWNTISIADDIKEFFVKEFVLPNLFLSDVPGYLLGRFRDFQGEAVYIRNILLPEAFFLMLEQKISGKFGEEGLARLYGVNKRFGYRFCTLARLPKSDLKFSVRLFYKFIEELFAESVEVNIDLDQKILSIDTKDLIITRSNGSGFMVGGSAGVWGYFLNDYAMTECGVMHIEGNHYVLISGPPEKLKEIGIAFYEAKDLKNIDDLTMYRDLNQPPDVVPPTASNLERLTRDGLLFNDKGQLKYGTRNVVLLSSEISLMYELESAFGDQVLYEAAKESFVLLGKDIPIQPDGDTFLADLLTSLGLGIVDVERGAGSNTFRFNGAPWYYTAKDSTFPVLRGAVEGFLEGHSRELLTASYIKSELRSGLVVLISASQIK